MTFRLTIIFSLLVMEQMEQDVFDVIKTVKELQHRYNERQREDNARMEMQ